MDRNNYIKKLKEELELDIKSNREINTSLCNNLSYNELNPYIIHYTKITNNVIQDVLTRLNSVLDLDNIDDIKRVLAIELNQLYYKYANL